MRKTLPPLASNDLLGIALRLVPNSRMLFSMHNAQHQTQNGIRNRTIDNGVNHNRDNERGNNVMDGRHQKQARRKDADYEIRTYLRKHHQQWKRD
jgi:hypothetical protein